MKRARGLLFILLLLCSSPRIALAHKVIADALVNEDGIVWIDVFFTDGTPVREAKVEIFLPDGTLFKEGRTGEQGRFTLSPYGPAGTWKVVANASMGHRAETSFQWKGAGKESAPLDKEKKSSQSTGAPRFAGKDSSPPAHRGEPVPWLGFISGLGFLMGLSAFVLSCYLLKELKRLKDARP